MFFQKNRCFYCLEPIQIQSSLKSPPDQQTIFILQMKAIKGVLSFVVNISELILQQRISPSKSCLQHLLSIKCQLNLLEHEQNPSEDICHFLINKEFYQIRNRLTSKLKHNHFQNTVITITFTMTDKLTSLRQVAEIWRISVVQKKEHKSKEDMAHEKIHAIKQTVSQIASQYIFSDVVLNRELNKKYIIDFHLDINESRNQQTSFLSETHNMWSASACLDANHQLKIECYWRSKMQISTFKRSPCNGITKRSKNKSEETCGDSCEINPTHIGSQRKLRSLSSQLALFQIYDSELEVTVLSNDSDSLSGSHHMIREVILGEDDEFELLIQENENKDDIFLKENDQLFQEWEMLALANFH